MKTGPPWRRKKRHVIGWEYRPTTALIAQRLDHIYSYASLTEANTAKIWLLTLTVSERTDANLCICHDLHT